MEQCSSFLGVNAKALGRLIKTGIVELNNDASINLKKSKANIRRSRKNNIINDELQAKKNLLIINSLLTENKSSDKKFLPAPKTLMGNEKPNLSEKEQSEAATLERTVRKFLIDCKSDGEIAFGLMSQKGMTLKEANEYVALVKLKISEDTKIDAGYELAKMFHVFQHAMKKFREDDDTFNLIATQIQFARYFKIDPPVPEGLEEGADDDVSFFVPDNGRDPEIAKNFVEESIVGNTNQE